MVIIIGFCIVLAIELFESKNISIKTFFFPLPCFTFACTCLSLTVYCSPILCYAHCTLEASTTSSVFLISFIYLHIYYGYGRVSLLENVISCRLNVA